MALEEPRQRRRRRHDATLGKMAAHLRKRHVRGPFERSMDQRAMSLARRERVSPPWRFGANEPVRRRSVSQRIAVDGAGHPQEPH